MIQHVYQRADKAESIKNVLVATDDTRIHRTVTAFGGKAVMTAPEHLSGTDRLAEVASNLSCELVVNVQGDEPLIEPSLIDKAVRAVAENPKLQLLTLRCLITDAGDLTDPNVVKVVVDRHGYALYFSRAPIPYAPAIGTQSTEFLGYKHIGLYVYRRESLLQLASLEQTPLERAERLEQLRALEHGFRILTVETTDDPIGVDTPEDLDRVRRIVSAEASA